MRELRPGDSPVDAGDGSARALLLAPVQPADAGRVADPEGHEMSADAKVWPIDDSGRWWGFVSDHDPAGAPANQTTSLVDALTTCEQQARTTMRWEHRVYPDGTWGLAGYAS